MQWIPDRGSTVPLRTPVAPDAIPVAGEEPRDPTTLARRMARLFPNALDTLEVLRGAGLDLRDVPLGSRRRSLVAVWKAAIAAADAQGRLPALLMAARQRYGHRRAILDMEKAEPVRTFIILISLLGLTLGATVGVAGFLVTLDSRTWTRVDRMAMHFEDLEVRERFRDEAPPAWAFWLPAPATGSDLRWPGGEALVPGANQATAPVAAVTPAPDDGPMGPDADEAAGAFWAVRPTATPPPGAHAPGSTAAARLPLALPATEAGDAAPRTPSPAILPGIPPYDPAALPRPRAVTTGSAR